MITLLVLNLEVCDRTFHSIRNIEVIYACNNYILMKNKLVGITLASGVLDLKQR